MEVQNSEGKKILSVKDLHVHYVTDDERLKAVNGVSLDLYHGKTLGLVGETGAGKTTIARSIMKTLPVPPSEVVGGEIDFYENGESIDLLKTDEEKMRQIRGGKISMIFQDPMSALNPVMCVGNQIREGIIIHEGLSKNEAKEKAEEMMEMVGIPAARYKEYPHQFSGGMKQRVIIAIALACNPEILIADEPTTALDVTIQAQVLDLIKGLQVRQDAAMLLITHDLGLIAQNADEVAIIYAGQIVEKSNTKELFHHPCHPYTRGLFAAIPSTAEKGAKRLHAIEGSVIDLTKDVTGCYFAPRCPNATAECYHAEEIPEFTVGEDHTCKCLLYKNNDQKEEET